MQNRGGKLITLVYVVDMRGKVRHKLEEIRRKRNTIQLNYLK